MTVDSFKFLPRIIAAIYETSEREPEYPIPWTALSKPLSECVFGLITSGGLYHKGYQPPFDIERERTDPTWGDPTYRKIPISIPQNELGVSHLHVSTQSVSADINVLLPIQRFQVLAVQGHIGSLSDPAYSFMGFQGYPPDTTAWQETYGPQVATAFKSAGVDCVLLTPS